MAYTTNQSNEIYRSMLAYINSKGGAAELNQLKQAINAGVVQSFVDRSVMGANHFFDALQIFYVETLGLPAELAEKMSAETFDMLLDKIVDLKDTNLLHNVLLGKTTLGYSVFNVIMKTNNVANLRKYFQVLLNACLAGVISVEEYKEILLGHNNCDYPPFHVAIMHGSAECVEEYLGFIMQSHFTATPSHGALTTKDDIENIWLSRTAYGSFTTLNQILITGDVQKLKVYKEYFFAMDSGNVLSKFNCRQLLMGMNDALFNAYHSVLQAGNAECTQLFLEMIKVAIDRSILDPEDDNKLILNLNRDKFSTCHQALNSNDHKNLAIYLTALYEAYKTGVISRDEYKKILVEDNRHGFSPLNHVLKKGKIANFNLYWGMIQTVLNLKIINNKDIIALFSRKTTRGFTPLHQVAASGNFELLQVVVNIMKNCLNSFFINSLLFSVTSSFSYRKDSVGFIPSCPVTADKPDAFKINQYLDGLRELYKEPLPVVNRSRQIQVNK